MAECCDSRGCAEEFDAAFAERMAARYRRRGLTRAERRLVDFLAADGVRGATVLEIGGGVGEIGLELLRRGAERCMTLELSSAYDEQAARLAADAGVADRVRRRLVDLAAEPEAVERADLVVLHRVVCCYPDAGRLLSAAAGRCRRRLAFTHPSRDPASRVVSAIENTLAGARGIRYRSFLHAPSAMLRALEEGGMRPVLPGRGWPWRVQGLVAA